jgi:hypothetical protein
MVLKLKTLQKLDQIYLESSEMLCWTKMEFIRWTDCVKNEQVSHTFEQERKNLHTIKQRDVNWNGHFLCRNCLLNMFVKKR